MAPKALTPIYLWPIHESSSRQICGDEVAEVSKNM